MIRWPKAAGLLLIGSMAVPFYGQEPAAFPEFFGFYHLNIPGFQWAEGAKVESSFVRLTGSLDMTKTSAPMFTVPGHEPIPLTFDQTSRLLISPGSSGPFEILGLEVTFSQEPGHPKTVFVPFEALLDHQEISLQPTFFLPKDEKKDGPARKHQEIQTPSGPPF